MPHLQRKPGDVYGTNKESGLNGKSAQATNKPDFVAGSLFFFELATNRADFVAGL